LTPSFKKPRKKKKKKKERTVPVGDAFHHLKLPVLNRGWDLTISKPAAAVGPQVFTSLRNRYHHEWLSDIALEYFLGFFCNYSSLMIIPCFIARKKAGMAVVTQLADNRKRPWSHL
jgi:hypothetical protein